jgi:hypothetical protein
MQRKGKIARLPHALRAELNRRLANNEDGATLLDWLNAAPEVPALLARDFGGEPISKQNLYEWRQGGFVEWQTRQDVLAEAGELAADAGDLTAAAQGDLTEHLITVLAGRYAAALAGWDGSDDEAFRGKLRLLSRLTRDLIALRRSKHDAARLKMEQECFARERERSELSKLFLKHSLLDPNAPRAPFCQPAATVPPSPPAPSASTESPATALVSEALARGQTEEKLDLNVPNDTPPRFLKGLREPHKEAELLAALRQAAARPAHASHPPARQTTGKTK